MREPKNCTTCAFKTFCGKTDFCTLHKQPLLNLEVGCDNHMYLKEFEEGSNSCMLYITDEEIQAAVEAKVINLMREKNNDRNT